ncbi:Elongation_factor 1-alpha [Hexamita inflata]|uniref:Elongation factor 1-alpha n=1 Tax=Hexamita inflata TaxID=28002 RepID=A0AA86U4H3_9EUKA|nr:Elongation factor 1-alpha [Hexamita inflata]
MITNKVVINGCVGTGKTTLANLLVNYKSKNSQIEDHYQDYEIKLSNQLIIFKSTNKNYIKNMISGVISTNIAVFMISALFEQEYDQIIQHFCFLSALGIQNLVVVINKMDQENVSYSKDRFVEIQTKLQQSTLMNNMQISYVPVSALNNENIVSKSEKMQWYTGLSLLDTLNSIKVNFPNKTDQPLCIPVEEVYKVSSVGMVPSGHIQSGSLKPGMNVHVFPTSEILTVDSFQMGDLNEKQAFPGYMVGFSLKSQPKLGIKQGFIISDARLPIKKHFQAYIYFTSIPDEQNLIITLNHATIHCSYSVVHKVSKQFKYKSAQIGEGLFVVKISPNGPFYAEKCSQNFQLGRFEVKRGEETIGTGIVTEIVE